MKRYGDKRLLLLALTAVTVVGSYLFLRAAYQVAQPMPFTQEVVLVILGTLATVLITALLLNQQTAVEIEKEQNIKFIEMKTRTYEQLIARIEEMSMAGRIGEQDLIRLRFITHRLALVASPEVLEEYHSFLETLGRCAADGEIGGDSDVLAAALARLTVRIRADLIGEADAMEADYSAAQIQRMILANSEESSDLHVAARGKERPEA